MIGLLYIAAMEQRVRGKPFHKGQSGNPKGRPAGARNRRTIALEEMLEGEIEAITRTAIDAAKNGDMAAIRLIMDRVLPPARCRPISIDLPAITDAASISSAQAEILRAVSTGDLLLDEAEALSALLEARRRSLEAADLEERIKQLEARV
jgi:hypothetical protein